MALSETLSSYGDVYEFLSAFLESMQLDPPWDENSRANAVTHLYKQYIRLLRGGSLGRTELLLLYRLGLVKPCDSSVSKLDGIPVCPVTRSLKQEEFPALLRTRILSWHPTRLLLRFLALNEGEATVDEIAAGLGCVVKRLTGELYDALLYVVPNRRVLTPPRGYRKSHVELCGERSEKGVLKPFNKLRIANLLTPLLGSLNLVEVDGDKLTLTEEGWSVAKEILFPPRSEVVRTQPLLPQLYAALLAVLYTPSRRLLLATPRIELGEAMSAQGPRSMERGDPGFIGTLLRLARTREIYVVVQRDGTDSRVPDTLLRLCQNTGKECCVSAIPSLNIRMYAGSVALLTSAEMRVKSFTQSFELGVYYRVIDKELNETLNDIVGMVHAQAGTRCL